MVLQQLWDGRSQQLQRITDKVIWIAQDESIGQHMNAQPSNEDRTSNDQLKEDLDGYRRAIDAFEDSLDQLFEDEVLSASSFPKDAQVLAEGQQRLPKNHESQTTVLSSVKNIIHRFFHLFTPKNTVLQTKPQTQNSKNTSIILASEVIAKRRLLLEHFRKMQQSEAQNGEAQDVDEFEACKVINYHQFKEIDSRFQLHCSRLPGIASWANWQQDSVDSRGPIQKEIYLRFFLFSIGAGFFVATLPRLLLGSPDWISGVITGLQIGTLWIFNRQSITELRQKRWRFWSLIIFLLSILIYWPLLPQLSKAYVRWGRLSYGASEGVFDRNLSSAKNHFQRAISLNPDNTKAHSWLGNIYEDLNKPDLAEEEYRIAAEGGEYQALNNLARIYILNDKSDIAISLLSYLEKTEKNQEERKQNKLALFFIYKNLGWALLKQDQPDYLASERYLREATNLESVVSRAVNRAIPYCFLAMALEGQGRTRQKEATCAWQDFQDRLDKIENISDYRIETHQCAGTVKRRLFSTLQENELRK